MRNRFSCTIRAAVIMTWSLLRFFAWVFSDRPGQLSSYEVSIYWLIKARNHRPSCLYQSPKRLVTSRHHLRAWPRWRENLYCRTDNMWWTWTCRNPWSHARLLWAKSFRPGRHSPHCSLPLQVRPHPPLRDWQNLRHCSFHAYPPMANYIPQSTKWSSNRS